MTEHGLDLLSRLLAYDPQQRITAAEALRHPYFTHVSQPAQILCTSHSFLDAVSATNFAVNCSENPLPKDPAMFPTFPSKGAGERKKNLSPGAPLAAHGGLFQEDGYEKLEGITGAKSTSFKLKF